MEEIVSPIRRLEKKINSLESQGFSSDAKSVLDETSKLIEKNQSLVSDILRSNNDLRNDVYDLYSRIGTLTDSMEKLLELLKIAAQETEPADYGKTLEILVEQNKNSQDINRQLISSLQMLDNRIKRLYRTYADHEESSTKTNSHQARGNDNKPLSY